MGRNWLCFFFLCLAAGSFAKPARAASSCDRIGERLTAKQLAGLKDSLIGLSSVEEVALAHRLNIVNDDDPRKVAPHSKRSAHDSPPTIYIPNGFARLQCQLVQIHADARIRALSEKAGRSRPIKRCLKAGKTEMRCLNAFFGVAAETAESRGRWTVPQRERLEEVTKGALLTTLLHEFAHLTLGHSRTDDLAIGARQETEADLYAAIRTAVTIDLPTGMGATFASISIMDRHLPTQGGVHGRFACRALSTNLIIAELSEPTSALYGWVTGRPTSSGAPLLPILGDTAGCPKPVPGSLAPLRSDLQRMASALVKYGRGKPQVATIGSEVGDLLALPLSDRNARRLRMSLVSLRVEALHKAAEEAAEGSLPSGMLEKLQIVTRRALAAEEKRALLSGDHGRLLGTRAILDYKGSLRVSALDQAIARVRPQLEEATYYHPEFATAHMHLGLTAYMSGQCEAGRRHLDQMVSLSAEPAQSRANLGPLVLPMGAAACAYFTQTLRKNTRDLYK